jgi:hypothetical protein
VTITVELLICEKCGTAHDSVPPVRTGVWNGKEETGVWAQDFTYYWDNYLSKGYVILCNKHKLEEIAQNVEGPSFAGI